MSKIQYILVRKDHFKSVKTGEFVAYDSYYENGVGASKLGNNILVCVMNEADAKKFNTKEEADKVLKQLSYLKNKFTIQESKLNQ